MPHRHASFFVRRVPDRSAFGYGHRFSHGIVERIRTPVGESVNQSDGNDKDRGHGNKFDLESAFLLCGFLNVFFLLQFHFFEFVRSEFSHSFSLLPTVRSAAAAAFPRSDFLRFWDYTAGGAVYAKKTAGAASEPSLLSPMRRRIRMPTL